VPVRRTNSAVGRRRLGSDLKKIREAAAITIEQVADRLECSSSKISRIENGHIGVSPRDVEAMLGFYGVTGERAEELLQVARDAREKGWWQAYGSVLVGTYVALEAAAVRIRAYEAQLVPGLLQIPSYTEQVMRGARPDIQPDVLKKRLEVRERRQLLLSEEDPLDLWVILDQAVITRLIGNAAIMMEQLRWLHEVAQRPNITVQVLPFDVGAHAGTDGTFSVLEYEQNSQDFVFVENAYGGIFLEKEEHLERYRGIFERLTTTALSKEASLAVIDKRAKELM